MAFVIYFSELCTDSYTETHNVTQANGAFHLVCKSVNEAKLNVSSTKTLPHLWTFLSCRFSPAVMVVSKQETLLYVSCMTASNSTHQGCAWGQLWLSSALTWDSDSLSSILRVLCVMFMKKGLFHLQRQSADKSAEHKYNGGHLHRSLLQSGW